IRSYLGRYILISTFGGGLNVYDTDTKAVEVIKNNPEDSRSLCDNEVRISLIDSKNNIWIGTQDGLSFLTGEAENCIKGLGMNNDNYEKALRKNPYNDTLLLNLTFYINNLSNESSFRADSSATKAVFHLPSVYRTLL
ncbi:MAG: hypothetical protein AAF571_11610, partial [Verrucomicrobiota bacterium]